MSLFFENFSKEDLIFYRGIEKEGLRTSNGVLAITKHPQSLGAALTNKFITTDYSESLLEMITPPFKDVDKLLNFLNNLHIFVNNKLDDNQSLWAASMPCILGEDSDIPIANYGKSNGGKMKHIYRRGLGHRYSRKMQSISGLHYNFSFSNSFWQKYAHKHNLNDNLQEIKNTGYFALIRNIHRYSDLLIYLLGCSPVAHQSFNDGLEYKCMTSIRMSEYGYTSNKQKTIKIHYDNLQEYITTLTKFINTKDNDYQKIGVKNNGRYSQLNDSILQIENEFYNIVRPKQSKGQGVTPSKKLQQNGVEYIELRLLDLNLFSPLGISKEQIYLLDLFLLFCISEPSPLIDDKELEIIEENKQRVINFGCQEHFMHINDKQQKVCFKEWGGTIMQKLTKIAQDLDKNLQVKHYQTTVKTYIKKIANGQNLAKKLKNNLKKNNQSFIKYTQDLSLQYKAHFLSLDKDEKIQRILQDEVQKSIKKQQQLEQGDNQPFDEFLQKYYQQCKTIF